MEFVFDYKDYQAVSALVFGSIDEFAMKLAKFQIDFNDFRANECIDIVDKAIAKAMQ